MTLSIAINTTFNLYFVVNIIGTGRKQHKNNRNKPNSLGLRCDYESKKLTRDQKHFCNSSKHRCQK